MVRYGIIGIGNMGSGHAKNFAAGKVPGAVITAVCDTNPEKLKWAEKELPADVKKFSCTEDFFKDGCFDVVVVATPHYDHPRLVIESLELGFHVITEKPAGVYTKAVREMNEAAKKSDKLFGIMYNQRTNPVYQKVRELVKSGELGEMKRVVWIITNWYRTQSYFNSGGWRATWAGEGGGVLLNQDPHQLDLWQWICGMPSKVTAFMEFGKMHDIEVEDDVTAFVTYPNGATGLFVTSTHETPGTNRLEISGDNGKIVVENDKVKFWRNRIGEREFNATCTAGFGSPECWEIDIPTRGENLQHIGIFRDFTSAVANGTPLLAPGIEGINGLTISNAMHLSAWLGSKTIDIDTLDEELYYSLLKEKIASSTFVKK